MRTHTANGTSDSSESDTSETNDSGETSGRVVSASVEESLTYGDAVETVTEPTRGKDVAMKELMALYQEYEMGIEDRRAFQNRILPLAEHAFAWDRTTGRVRLSRCNEEQIEELVAALKEEG